MPPRMIVVAGPPGSGKSSIFPLAKFGTKYFNTDDRAAELNDGFYVGIPCQSEEHQLRKIMHHPLSGRLAASDSAADSNAARGPIYDCRRTGWRRMKYASSSAREDTWK